MRKHFRIVKSSLLFYHKQAGIAVALQIYTFQDNDTQTE